MSSCCPPTCVHLTHIFNHSHVPNTACIHTHTHPPTQNANRDTQPDFPALFPHVPSSPGVSTGGDVGSLKWHRDLHLKTLIVMQESVRQDVLYVLFKRQESIWTNAHVEQRLLLRHLESKHSLSLSLRLYSHCVLVFILNMPTYCLESSYLAEYKARQYTEMIIRLSSCDILNL